MNNREFEKKYYIVRDKDVSVKYSRCKDENSIPMWIADMDFKDDERILEALNTFISNGDFGYGLLPKDYLDTFISWHQRRNGVTYDPDAIRYSKGAVDAMYDIIYSLTEEGDSILVNTPLYPPFKGTIIATKRKVVESKLINTNNYFTFDFKDMERKFKKGKIKMMFLCSPHNPIGRVWKKGELEELFDLCKKYNVIVCSDEVHSDLIMPDQKFIPSLAFKKYEKGIVTITAFSKTFSLAVFSHSHIICPNKRWLKKIDEFKAKYHKNSVNVFNALPTYYGMKYGEEWLDTLNNVVFENYNYIKDNLGDLMEMTNLEGSYLLFLNIGEFNKADSAAKYLEENCNIYANPGESFDSEYANWVRLNLATSLENIKKAVDAILKITK